ncbi:hypothetical protein WJX73_008822 [Symbiochloris irregularis]|uniref:Uncharacterized protein n=1 Tax=Symbiochloris irregularis TaxID=706552 RepID=A0AAW1PJS7_9CHLO
MRVVLENFRDTATGLQRLIRRQHAWSSIALSERHSGLMSAALLPAARRLLANRGYVDPNFPNPNGPGDASIIIYGYTPSLVLGVIGAVYFGLVSAATLAGILKLSWDTLIFLLGFGTVMEVVGYIFRCLSSQIDPYRVNFFVIQYFFIVVAPVFFAAAIYLCLQRLIWSAGPKISPLSPRAVFAIFLTLDIITILMQIAGAALIGVAESNGKDPNTANDILIAGLAIQSASFAVFLIILVVCVARLVGQRAGGTVDDHKHRESRQLFVLLLLVAVLVELRTAFRLAEAAEGVFSYLSTHEVFFGCLEFVPIALAVVPLLYLGWTTGLIMKCSKTAQTTLTPPQGSSHDAVPPAV